MDGLNTVLLTELQNTKSCYRCHSLGIESINARVPQGSVLESFLSLIYINDIFENISNQIRLFADDTSLVVLVDDKPLTADLEIIKQWSNQWKADLNPNKTINGNLIFFRKKIHKLLLLTLQIK